MVFVIIKWLLTRLTVFFATLFSGVEHVHSTSTVGRMRRNSTLQRDVRPASVLRAVIAVLGDYQHLTLHQTVAQSEPRVTSSKARRYSLSFGHLSPRISENLKTKQKHKHKIISYRITGTKCYLRWWPPPYCFWLEVNHVTPSNLVKFTSTVQELQLLTWIKDSASHCHFSGRIKVNG